jgi:predicted nucleic acid-binding Zn ribbon protein
VSGGTAGTGPPRRVRLVRAGRTLELSESLAQLSRQIGTAPPAALGQIFSRWAETVGESLASHVRPDRIDGDALVVTVDSPAWASHLRTHAPELLAKLSDVVDVGAPTSLVIRVGRGRGRSDAGA